MTWTVVLYGVLLVAIAVGVVGAFVPALPGISVILAAVVIWGLVVGFAQVSWALGITVLALLLSLIVGYLAAYLGAKESFVNKLPILGYLNRTTSRLY